MQIITDLSKEWHPQPKVYKSKNPPKKLHAGEKTKAWDEVRDELKKVFAARGITECELQYQHCWRNNGLTFAHAAKRRKLSKEDLRSVILLCVVCHQKIEFLPAEEMRKIVMDVIKKRKVSL